MNSYSLVFYFPKVEYRLRMVGEIYLQAGYIQGSLIRLQGCQLSTAFTQGIIAIEKVVVFKSRLIDVPEFNDEHIDRALAAAKNPQLRMKPENMPVPMTAEMVHAAKTSDLELNRNVL